MESEGQPDARTIDVAAGLVFRQGRLLITQRPAGSHLAGLWEFPGGKRERTETFEQCLSRELEEELGIDVEVGLLLQSISHQYPEKLVHLRFFCCRWLRHEPQAIGCAAFAWVNRSELRGYPFPAADSRLLQLLEDSKELWQE